MQKKIISFEPGTANVSGSQIVEFDDSQLSALRVVPELAPLVQGYKNEAMVAESLFKSVPVKKENGKFPAFGKEAFKLWDATRALRGPSQHMDVVSGAVEYNLTEKSLGFMIDDRELEEFSVSKDFLMTQRTQMVLNALDVKEEYDAAFAAITAGNYSAAVSGASYAWASDGDPMSDLLLQKETIRQAIGMYPNTVVFDPKAWRLFRTNANVRSYLRGFVVSGSATGVAIVTEQLVAAALEVQNVLVGKMVYGYGPGGGVGETALTMADIWGSVQAGNVALAYTGTGFGTPTFGMNFMKEGYPRAVSYRLEQNHSDVFDVQRIYQKKITLASAGQLIYSIA